MDSEMNRRGFLQLGIAAGVAALAPRLALLWLAHLLIALQMRAGAAFHPRSKQQNFMRTSGSCRAPVGTWPCRAAKMASF